MTKRKYPGMTHGNRQLVSMILLRQEGKCFYCRRRIFIGVSQNDGKRATLDHKTPMALGGEPYGENAVVACHRCNGTKGCLDAETFLAVIDDHPARKAALKVALAQIGGQTTEEKRMIHRRIKRSVRQSRHNLWLSLQPVIEEFRKNRADVG